MTEILGPARGSYDIKNRVMLINKEFNPQNPMDIMSVYHETVHALQIFRYWNFFNSPEEFQNFVSFFSSDDPKQKGRTIGHDEHEAYLLESLALDNFTDGEFGKTVIDGNYEAFASKWGILPKDISQLEGLGLLTKLIHETGTTIDYYDPRYVRYINGLLRKADLDVYRITADKRITLDES